MTQHRLKLYGETVAKAHSSYQTRRSGYIILNYDNLSTVYNTIIITLRLLLSCNYKLIKTVAIGEITKQK